MILVPATMISACIGPNGVSSVAPTIVRLAVDDEPVDDEPADGLGLAVEVAADVAAGVGVEPGVAAPVGVVAAPLEDAVDSSAALCAAASPACHPMTKTVTDPKMLPSTARTLTSRTSPREFDGPEDHMISRRR